MKSSYRPLLLLSALVLAHLLLLWFGDLSLRVGWTVATLMGASLLLWCGVGWLGRVPLTAGVILIGAAILRFLMLPLAPALSDDILRYVWDGKVAAAGFNPYLEAPSSALLAGVDDALNERLPHRDVATVYPPVAMAVFAVSSKFPNPFVALKLVLVIADLLACSLLLKIAMAKGLPERRVLLYAWNPLVTLEVAGMGHVDALGIAAVAATVFFLVTRPQRAAYAAVAASVAVLAKIVPIVAWPAWARQSARNKLFVLVGSGILAISLGPIVLASGGIPPGYIRFGVSWEFNGPIYEPLWRLIEWLRLPRGVAGVLEAAKTATGWHALLNHLYPFNYPQFIARGLLILGCLHPLSRAWKERDVLRSTGSVFAVILLFSTTVYPWYALWVLPWAALLLRRPWLLLAALLPLSYLPQFLDLELFPAIFCAIWVPFLVALVSERRWPGN